MPLPALRRRTVLAAGAALVTTPLVGCGASEPVSRSKASTKIEGATTYPLKLENCGEALTFDGPPQRVVSLDQGSTELLLSLGLADRIVGTASWTDPILDSLAEANADVPRLADDAPTYEVALGADPDFITASFGRHFAEGGVAERSRFAEIGVPTYLSPTDCDNGKSVNGGTTRTHPLTVDSLYQEIRELAQIFDVPSRGEKLIATLKKRTEQALAGPQARGLSLAFWFADTKTPYVAGGLGSASMLCSLVGATNVFSDLEEDWPAVGWETLVDRAPDALVLGDLHRARFPGDLLEDKIDFLESDALASTLRAVDSGSYVALHGAEMNPSIRFVDGLEKITAWLSEREKAS